MKLALDQTMAAAAYLAMGATQAGTAKLQEAVDAYGAGQDGFITDLTRFAPYIESLWNAIAKPDAIPGFYAPGVWTYDVTEAAGQWIIETYFDRAPDGLAIDPIVTGIKDLVVKFMTGTDGTPIVCHHKLREVMDTVSTDMIGDTSISVEV
jgi:hypothetical protein